MPEGRSLQRGQGNSWLWAGLILVLLLMAGCVLIVPALAAERGPQVLPVSLRARGQADYSADPLGTSQPALQLALIGDVLRDLDPDSADIDQRVIAVMDALDTPVVTEPPTRLPTFTSSPSIQVTDEPSPTMKATVVGSGTPASLTPAPTASATSTQPPTATPTPTSPAATATLTITPSITSLPSTSTSTPTADLCSELSLSGLSQEGQQVVWEIENEGPSSVTISSIYINWPGTNEELVKVEFAGDAIWDQEDEDPPTNISGGWKEGESRTLGSNSSEPLLFQFEEEAKATGYNLTVSFENGCSVSD